ncbi:MAG: SHOCT domain-containing protein [Methanomassiliicoccus sp.]|nr:SHOCT domain-containing protein [Methanomassiliicoccus sp.]
MRGRGVALLIGMKAGQSKAQQQVAAQEQAKQAQQQAYEKGAQDAQAQAQQASAPAPVPSPAPTGPSAAGGDLTAQLQNLANLHAQGILSDEEFAAAKKKLLSG